MTTNIQCVLHAYLNHIGKRGIARSVLHEEHVPTLKAYARLVLGSIYRGRDLIEAVEHFNRLELI